MDNDKFIFVFRVENEKDGLGPYDNKQRSYFIEKMIMRHNNDFEGHPLLGDEIDCCFFVHGKHFFGFISLDHLFTWFKRNLSMLHVNGYKISTYKVNQKHVTISKSQCVFEKDQATKLGLFSLRTKREILERKIGRLAEESLLTAC